MEAPPAPARKPGSRLYFFGILAVVALIVFYALTDTEVKDDYRAEIRRFRAEKETFFREDKGSPIEDKASYRGLRYFDPAPEFRLSARLQRLAPGDSVTIKLSDGTQEAYQKYAYATFQLGGQPQKMLLLKHPDDDGLFLPFADSTSGFDTYGGGRYLDLKLDKNKPDQLMIDFNFAYNPFCAYNAHYSCPLPPPENKLALAIRAGEKNYVPK